MDMVKFYEFFQPEKVTERIHIIGCGAVGSTIAELLARMGLTKFTLYDFDTVESHNIANQLYRHIDIGKPKTEALAGMLRDINPDVDIKMVERYNGQRLSGYVFMAVDTIAVRRDIVTNNIGNIYIKAVFDVRLRLTDAQGYAARWSSLDEQQNLLNTMNFTDEEAAAETPTTACNVALSVAPTVRMICNEIVVDFVNLIQGKDFRKMIFLNAFNFENQVIAM